MREKYLCNPILQDKLSGKRADLSIRAFRHRLEKFERLRNTVVRAIPPNGANSSLCYRHHCRLLGSHAIAGKPSIRINLRDFL